MSVQLRGDSTDEETRYVSHCLHTISIFERPLLKYRWSVAAYQDDSVFRPNWWQRREWAKTAFMK